MLYVGRLDAVIHSENDEEAAEPTPGAEEVDRPNRPDRSTLSMAHFQSLSRTID